MFLPSVNGDDRKPWLWGNEAGGHLWRTTWDSRDMWETEKYDNGHAGIMNILDKQVGLETLCWARWLERPRFADGWFIRKREVFFMGWIKRM